MFVSVIILKSQFEMKERCSRKNYVKLFLFSTNKRLIFLRLLFVTFSSVFISDFGPKGPTFSLWWERANQCITKIKVQGLFRFATILWGNTIDHCSSAHTGGKFQYLQKCNGPLQFFRYKKSEMQWSAPVCNIPKMQLVRLDQRASFCH